MTISTVTFQNDALAQFDALDAALLQTQNELSTGSKLPNAAADPVAMTQVNQLNSEISASQQYSSNGTSVNANLQLEESALTSATNILQSARDLAVEANNSSLNASQRQAIAVQLQQELSQLVDAANSTDSNGNYLFSGTATGTQPFAQQNGSVGYFGSETVNQVQIGPDQSISAGDTGSAVFSNIVTGNGTFTTAAAATNTGTASIDTGSVTDAAAWVPDTYTISFTSPTQYQVTNSGGAIVSAGTYTSGDAISFEGVSGVAVTVSGTPATGDEFTIAPSSTASAFSTLSGIIATLNSASLNSGQIATALGGSVQQIDNVVNNLDNVQASVGARINAISTAQSNAQSTQTTLQSSVSTLSDTDYAATTTQLSTEEIALQAAEESYASLAKLSLFNYVQ